MSTGLPPRPTMPGVNSWAVGRYRPTGTLGYVALFNDGTTGLLRGTRPEAEQDYAATREAAGK